MIYRFPGIEKTTLEFRIALVDMAEEIRVDPNAVAAIMSVESGFDPKAHNPHGAVGLIQFMPSTLKAWGMTPDQVLAMSAIEQLGLVRRFYKNYPETTDPGDLYMATFLPKYMHAPDGFILGAKGSAEIRDGLSVHKIWAQNAGLDVNKDGLITVGEVKALARGRYQTAKARGPVDPQPPIDEGLSVPPVPVEVDWDELRAERDRAVRDGDDE